VVATGVAEIGVAAIGVATTGTEATGVAAIGTTGAAIGTATTTMTIMTSSSSAASAFRSGAGDIRTAIMAMATHTDMATVMVTLTATAMATTDTDTITASPVTDTAMGPAQELRNCSGDSLVPAIMVGLSMESWDPRRGEQFGPTSATTDMQADPAPQSRLELGLRVSRGLQRANDLDC
jgi:hypothetical protein